MPGSIILSTIYGSVAAATAALGATLYTATVFAINFAVSYTINRVFGAKPPRQQDSGVRLQVPPSSNNSIPVVYGDAWMGGTFVDAVLTSDNQAMYYVLAISNISPNGQFTYDTTQFYYGDRLVTFAPGTNRVASLTDGAGNVDTKIDGYLYINLYTSTAAGTITTVLGTAPNVAMGGSDIPLGLRWPSSGRQMNGLAFAIIYLKYNTDAGTSGLQPVTFKVKHALNGTGVAKPGSVLKDYLTNTVYGGAVPLANVNTTACDDLDIYSDQTITYTPSGGGSATQARYRINGVLDTGETVLNNIENILMACDSWIGYQAETGQWLPIINKAEATTFAFDDSNIIGEIRVSATDITSSINQIEVSFPWKENKDKPGFVFLETPAGLLYPNEPKNKYTTSFSMVNDSVQAQYLANRMLEQAREDLIVSFNTAYPGIQVNAGEVVGVTNSAYGWTNKLFRVVKVNEASLPDGNLGARFELSEYNSQVYDDASITAFTPAPNSDLQSGYYFPALSAPTFSDQQPSLSPPTFSVTCQLPSTVRVTKVTLYYTKSATPTQTDWDVWGTQTPINDTAFTAGAAIKFTNVIVGAGTYYFAFSVGNEISTSQKSATSLAFSWAPIISSLIATQWSPVVIQVPRTAGVPSFTGINPQFYLTFGGTQVNFVTSQTDSDAAFINNTWRIGNSSTTGNGDITTTGGLVMGAITDGGVYAQWGNPTAMTSSPALLSVPARYKDNTGTVYQAAFNSLQFAFLDSGPTGPTGSSITGPTGPTGSSITGPTGPTGSSITGPTGASGNQTATVYLYQWSTVQPGNPSGTTIYTWATGSNASYTGGNSWSVTVPANPGTPGIYLWVASKQIVASAGTVTTSVDWTTGYTIAASTGNGINGVKTAEAIVYQWAATIPTISGTSTYTWASDSVSSPPTNWFTTISDTGSPGFTLWAATVTITDSVTATTTSINWATASILPFGYSGSTGAVARVAYTAASGSLNTSPQTFTVAGDALPSIGSWGAGQVWSYTTPTLSAGQAIWQSDGIYNPTNNQTIWGLPYLSSLKVGNLSAISTNTGSLTVSGNITVGSFGNIRGGQTAYNTGTGFFLGYSGTNYRFSIGSATQSLLWDGSALTLNGNIVSSGKAEFYGNNSDLLGTAVKANSTAAADVGFLGYAGTTALGVGVSGQASASSAIGVVGVTSSTSARTGVLARTTVSGGTALEVDGLMKTNNTTLVTNLNADYVDGKHASAFVQVATGTTNDNYIYFVNNNTAPTDPNNRAVWIRLATNDGGYVYFPGYL